MPTRAKLTDIEIGLGYEGGGGGCVGRCMKYSILIRGTGLVEYKDLGGEPRGPERQRSIAVDQVVSLLNEFLRARFLEAPPNYPPVPVGVRDGDSVLFPGRVAAPDGLSWDVTLRVGTQTKKVHLYDKDFPAEFGRLRDLVDNIGGPKAWSAR